MEADGSGWEWGVPGREASRMRPRAPSGNLGYGGASPGGGAALEFGMQ